MIISGYEFLAYLATLLCFELAARFLVLKNLDKEGSDKVSTSRTGSGSELKPAEVAYLVRGGDSTHALIVLAADLMQRALKKSDDLSFLDKLTEYEKNMWQVTTKALKDWAYEKTKKNLIGNSVNPIQIAKRLSFVYKFITSSLKTMVADAISDPKKLRKYFSANGLWRIIADFTSAGYKQAFEIEIRSTLLKRGLLIDKTVLRKNALVLLSASLLGLIGIGIVATIAFQTWYLALLLLSGALLSAFALRTVLIVRQLLPFYEELQVVAEQINRKSRRLKFIKIVLASVDTINWMIALFVLGTISSITLVLAKLVYFNLGMPEIYAYLGLTFAAFACIDVLFKAVDMNMTDYPSAIARQELLIIKADLKDKKPLDSFKEILESQTYDPQFSKLIAIYGVETLFILA